jgi:hypothetical protein
MTLRLRRLEIRAVTQDGTVGTNIDFVDGLNVLGVIPLRGGGYADVSCC